MSGLAKICKMYGRMVIADKDGNKFEWVYDYAKDKPRLKSEMTKQDIEASERAKYSTIKSELK